MARQKKSFDPKDRLPTKVKIYYNDGTAEELQLDHNSYGVFLEKMQPYFQEDKIIFKDMVGGFFSTISLLWFWKLLFNLSGAALFFILDLIVMFCMMWVKLGLSFFADIALCTRKWHVWLKWYVWRGFGMAKVERNFYTYRLRRFFRQKSKIEAEKKLAFSTKSK